MNQAQGSVFCHHCNEAILTRADLYVVGKIFLRTLPFHRDCYAENVLDGKYTGGYGAPRTQINHQKGKAFRIRRLRLTILAAFIINWLALEILALVAAGNSLLLMIIQDPENFPFGGLLVFMSIAIVVAIFCIVEIQYVRQSWERYEKHLPE